MRVSGSSTWKRLPSPGADSASMRPPIISVRAWQMDRPSPAPPKRRVMEASAWLNRWNNCAA